MKQHKKLLIDLVFAAVILAAAETMLARGVPGAEDVTDGDVDSAQTRLNLVQSRLGG